jgi:hypothetical protein
MDGTNPNVTTIECGPPYAVNSYPDNIGTHATVGYSSIQTCVIPNLDSP